MAIAGVEFTLEEFCRISLRQGESILDLATVAAQGKNDATELRRVRDEIYYRLLGEGARVFPGVRDILEQLHGPGLQGLTGAAHAADPDGAHHA